MQVKCSKASSEGLFFFGRPRFFRIVVVVVSKMFKESNLYNLTIFMNFSSFHQCYVPLVLPYYIIPQSVKVNNYEIAVKISYKLT